MGCCGGRNKKRAEVARDVPPSLLGAAGLVLLEYQGNGSASPWYGNVTGARYLFSTENRRRFVDKDDAPRLLTMTLDGQPAFVEVVE